MSKAGIGSIRGLLARRLIMRAARGRYRAKACANCAREFRGVVSAHGKSPEVLKKLAPGSFVSPGALCAPLPKNKGPRSGPGAISIKAETPISIPGDEQASVLRKTVWRSEYRAPA